MNSIKYDEFGTYIDSNVIILANVFVWLNLVFMLMSSIGTFVSTIVMLVKSSSCNSKSKNFYLGASIAGITLSALAFIVMFIGSFVNAFVLILPIIFLSVSFGLNIACTLKVKKEIADTTH